MTLTRRLRIITNVTGVLALSSIFGGAGLALAGGEKTVVTGHHVETTAQGRPTSGVITDTETVDTSLASAGFDLFGAGILVGLGGLYADKGVRVRERRDRQTGLGK